MPAAEKFVVKMKLNSELSHVRLKIKGIGGDCVRRLPDSYASAMEDSIISESASLSDKHLASLGRKRKSPDKQWKDVENFSSDAELLITEKSEVATTVTSAFKGDKRGRMDSQGLKMDAKKRRQCAIILKKLMTHPSGWVFNQPVDPLKLNIPDYFAIISKPMDLGTIKHKLERKLYLSTAQFAADVRLTFSNAMTYNPPANFVHVMAKDLNTTFNSKWKLEELKWTKECSVAVQKSVTKTVEKQTLTSKQVVPSASSCSSNLSSCKFLTSANKLKLQKDLEILSRGSIPPQLLRFLQKASLLGQGKDKIDIDIDTLDEQTLWELHHIITSCGNAGTTKSAGAVKKPSQCLMMDVRKDNGSERSCRENFASHSIASNLDCKDTIAGMQRGHASSYSGPAIVDVDTALPTSRHSSPAATSRKEEDDPPCEEQLSPTRALRAVLLKQRFADTILKARQKTLLNNGEKGDSARMQREKEKLEKQQEEEKARIEAEVKAAKVAAQMKAESDLKMQREKEREAARLALQKMEKTVDIDENSEIFKDLGNLGYSQPVYLDIPDEMVVNYTDGVEEQSCLRNPLAQLGLFIKDDDLDEEAGDYTAAAGNGDVEEGEIGSS